ncbi:MAG TPA: DUF3347 domain-containing protein [Hanamia sp.]|nr:DUF3347 domain-containing protein [Hanamia sp.]
MRTIFILGIFIATAFSQKSFAQDASQSNQLSSLLNNYYEVKDALVNSNPDAAALQARVFLKTIKDLSKASLSKEVRNALMKPAESISATKDIKIQREAFATLSTNMYDFVKAQKPGGTIYYAYCPMKKSYWLSSEKAIKNPYYGNMMLTCGNVSDTIE